MNRLIYLCFIILICSFSSLEMKAQMDVECKVKVWKKGQTNDTTECKPEALFWGLLTNAKGRKLVKVFDKLKREGDPEKNAAIMEELRDAYLPYTTGPEGDFSVSGVVPGNYIVAITYDNWLKIFEIKEGKTYYNDTVTVQRYTEDLETKSKRRKKEYGKITNTDWDDGTVKFTIVEPIPAGYAKDNTRIMFQLYAVDCQTEDTVSYLNPIVFEGADYHSLQNKRKNYDYFRFDPVHEGYDSTYVLHDGVEMVIKTSVTYQKPDKKKDYRGAYAYTIEDYHHVSLKDSKPGSCLKLSPLKFLDFSVAEEVMKLTTEFFEQALPGLDSTSQDLAWRFQQNSAELVEDPTYSEQIDSLENELSQIENLVKAELLVSTSPEGSEESNSKVAQRRANFAASLIRMPRGIRVEPKKKLYSWEDTADELEKQGEVALAQLMRETLAKCGRQYRDRDNAMKKLPGYEEKIVPEMNRERKVTFTYMSQKMKIKSPKEAEDAYYRYKNNPNFSMGDYYNIFNRLINRKDTAELDTLTRIVYNRIMKSRHPEYEKLYPYVVNQMAIAQNRIGNPDTMILKSLIVDTLGLNDRIYLDVNTNKYLIRNRPEYLMNQAVAFFKLQNFQRAKEMLEMLRANNCDQMESYKRLRKFIDFRELLKKDDKRTDEEETRFQEALHFVEGSGIDNKAILYTELPDQLHKQNEAEQYVDKMADGNPVKWYLKGILYATEDKLEKMNNDSRFAKGYASKGIDISKLLEDSLGLGITEDDIQVAEEPTTGIDVKGIAFYLAYFQHAFDLDEKMGKKDMARYYFKELHVSEDLRKKYPYKLAKIPAYRELFNQLKEEIDAKRKSRKDDNLLNDQLKDLEDDINESKKEDDVLLSL